MPLKSLLFVAIFATCLVGSFVNPMYGLAVYLLEYYQRPGMHWWGSSLPDLRWNFVAAFVFAATYLMRRSSPPAGVRALHGGLLFLLALGGYMLLVNLWAIQPDESWKLSNHFWKVIAIYFLIAGVLRTRGEMDIFLLLNVIGAGWWGVDALDARRIQGRLEGVGAYDTINSNLLAGHLLTIIPIIVVFLVGEKDKRIRLVALLALPFVLNCFILANSRGAMVGLVVSLLVGLVLVRFGQRKRAVLVSVAAGVIVYALADPVFIARQQTTTTATDASAQDRRKLWAGTMEMIADYPLGAGGRGFHILSPRYAPEAVAQDSGGRSSHNSYLQLAAEWGLPGLVFWLLFLGSAFRCLHRVRRRSTEPDWFYYRSLALELGLVGTLVAAFFSVRFYGESIYWMAAAAYALEVIDVKTRDTSVPRTVPHQARAVHATGSAAALSRV